ncbi:MAG: YabP/YqfC family sporulation protein [Acutalibacteraceae bacterium]|nr:YabP/YqfC family sporulation protein [Acutalibacteraceae bacterium]
MSKKIKLGLKAKNNKIKFFEKDENNDIVSFGDYCINFISNKKVIIEGCKSVTDYNDAFISLNLGKRIITILGSNIQIVSYTENEIIVTGTFSKLEFGE